MKSSQKPRKPSSNNVFSIGLLSFFGGISQDIFVPILPLYLSNVLGLSKEFIGLSSGLVTSSASIFKIVAGLVSDRLRVRKSMIFLGYFLSLVGRFFLAFTTSGAGVLFLRFLDGAGKGSKDSPKDALIASSVDIHARGRGFGIVRALDTLGSVVGPLILFGLLYLLQNNELKYHYIFLFTAIPLFFTLSILTLFVKESVSQQNQPQKLITSDPLPLQFYLFLAITVIFSIGNSADAFLILRAQDVGVTLLAIPVVYALFNFFYASASIPLGSLSDRIGREKVILLGWVTYALAYLGFGLASHSYQIWILFAFYGLYYATTEGVAKAYIADITSPEHRGKVYGIYNSVIGLMALPASTIAGYLWDKYNPATPFYFGAIMSFIAVVLLMIFMVIYPSRISKKAIV